MDKTALLWGGAGVVGLLALSARASAPSRPTMATAPSKLADKPGKPRPYYNPSTPSAVPWISPMLPDGIDGGTWEGGAYLTEYHPNAPASQKKMEGGLYDRKSGKGKHPVIFWEQHAADPKKYPFVTVASDIELRGRKVPYGARLHLEAYPEVEFRLMDTGGHFFGDDKVIRKPGHEPFDIATSYQANKEDRLNISGKTTRYRVDFRDVIEYPSWLAVQRDRAAVA